MRGRISRVVVTLDEPTQKTLKKWVRSTKTPARRATRARAILLLADGGRYVHVARAVGMTERNVRKWARQFLAHGLLGLFDQPRSGRPPRPILITESWAEFKQRWGASEGEMYAAQELGYLRASPAPSRYGGRLYEGLKALSDEERVRLQAAAFLTPAEAAARLGLTLGSFRSVVRQSPAQPVKLDTLYGPPLYRPADIDALAPLVAERAQRRRR